jgi:cbb3-type cytochrome oxidase maturation protein
MNILLVLIPVTLLVIVIAVALFFWAVNHQQFDDLDSPAELPLMDDPPPDAVPSSQPDRDSASRTHSDQDAHHPRDPDQG